MNMYPQPSPNSPGALSSGATLRARRQSKWILIVGFIAIVGVFGVGWLGWLSRTRGHEPWERPFKNARILGMTLAEFADEFGQPPGNDTLAAVRNRGTAIPLGSRTSNDFLRQLIAAGMVDDERMFFAPLRAFRQPDNRMDGAEALEKGECGFSYLIGPDFNSGPPQPIIVTPLIAGTNRFDAVQLDGWAIILWTDLRVNRLPVNRNGQVMHLGKHLLDPANPIWNGKPPVIAWPE